MNIKDLLNTPDINDSEVWLSKLNLSYDMREKQTSDESLYVSELTAGSWMERLRELCKGYQLKDIWNMDKSGCFLKHFLPKALCEKEKNVKLNKSQSKE